MKIFKFTSENVKRLHYVEITPDGNHVTIAGKNGAGKSSVFDSIKYAMGGKEEIPAQPIRNGEREAYTTLDLGDIIVTRKYWRDDLPCDCGLVEKLQIEKLQPINLTLDAPVVSKEEHTDACASRTFGPTKTSVSVKNKDGITQGTPQSILDKLHGRLTFDPLVFARSKPDEQDRLLRTLVGLDVSAFENARAVASAQRLQLKKQFETKSSILTTLPKFLQEAGLIETPIKEVMDELRRAEELRTLAGEAKEKLDSHNRHLNAQRIELEFMEHQLKSLAAELERKNAQLQTAQQAHDQAKTENGALQEQLNAAAGAVPDMEELQQKVQRVEDTNAKIRANVKYKEACDERDKIARAINDETTLVAKADEGKAAALRAVTFPVDGLGLSDAGVTFRGVPLEQASSSEQIRVSVAIGMALNPQLKVLLIRNANMLDSGSRQQINEQAKAADYQVWLEWVAETKEGASVMLEDGSVI